MRLGINNKKRLSFPHYLVFRIDLRYKVEKMEEQLKVWFMILFFVAFSGV
jgi:hypothetical protein